MRDDRRASERHHSPSFSQSPGRKSSNERRTLKKSKTKSGWTVYILRCADGSLYTGITRDAVRRVAEHNSNGRLAARYTRSRRPVVLVYQESAASRSLAGKREYRIKRMTRAEKQGLAARGGRRRPRKTGNVNRES